jgi:hypothetical protein
MRAGTPGTKSDRPPGATNARPAPGRSGHNLRATAGHSGPAPQRVRGNFPAEVSAKADWETDIACEASAQFYRLYWSTIVRLHGLWTSSPSFQTHQSPSLTLFVLRIWPSERILAGAYGNCGFEGRRLFCSLTAVVGCLIFGPESSQPNPRTLCFRVSLAGQSNRRGRIWARHTTPYRKASSEPFVYSIFASPR